MEQKTQQQDHGSGGKCKQGQGWNSHPGKDPEETGMQKRGSGSFSRTADDGDKNGLEEQEPQPGKKGGNNQAHSRKHREDNEIQGQEKSDGFKGNASRPGARQPARRKKIPRRDAPEAG